MVDQLKPPIRSRNGGVGAHGGYLHAVNAGFAGVHAGDVAVEGLGVGGEGEEGEEVYKIGFHAIQLSVR